MEREYIYEPVGTTLTDYQDGRLILVYGRPCKDLKEVQDQAMWLGDTLDKISKERPKEKFQLLVDLEKLMKLQLDTVSKDIYKEIISRKYLKKIAMAGDVVNYSKVISLMIITRLRPSKTRFFFNMPGAHKWLRW